MWMRRGILIYRRTWSRGNGWDRFAERCTRSMGELMVDEEKAGIIVGVTEPNEAENRRALG